MVKLSAKTKENVTKVKKVVQDVKEKVVKKSKESGKKVLDAAKPAVMDAVEAFGKTGEENIKKDGMKALEKLKVHARKHVTNWHNKAGEHKSDFAKDVLKHAKELLK